MKLKFFLPRPKGAAPAPPSITVRRKGQHSGASLYELLPPEVAATAARVKPAQASAKQVGVGRGKYARTTVHQQAMSSRG